MLIQILDFTGAALAFLATIFFIRLSIYAWPISLGALAIDIVLYFRQGLYADMGLNSIYFVMMLYGWYQWIYGGEDKTALHITNLSRSLAFKLSIIGIALFVVISTVLRFYTDSQVPFWDAGTAIISLIAQWLTCKKIMQNWQLWFLVDGLYAGLYFYKGIPLHASLQIVYLGMAVIGYYAWQKKFALQNVVIG